jgi:hypothetical protein
MWGHMPNFVVILVPIYDTGYITKLVTFTLIYFKEINMWFDVFSIDSLKAYNNAIFIECLIQHIAYCLK